MFIKNWKKEILTIPNLLSLFRLVLIPIYVAIYLNAQDTTDYYLAAGILAVSCLTDMIDGKIARKYNLITDFGKFMDQIADKFIATTAVILIMFENVLPVWAGALVIIIISCRDTLVGGIRQVAASKGTVIPADMFGKFKSLFLDTSSIVLMLFIGLTKAGVEAQLLMDIVYYIGISLLAIGVVLTLVSGVNYTIKAIPFLKENHSVAIEEPVETEEEK